MAAIQCRVLRDRPHCAIVARERRRRELAVEHILVAYAPAHVLAPAPRYPRLSWCVAGAEGGHVVNLDTGNGFLGTFQWVWSTWTSTVAAMGVTGVFPASPLDASYEQQAAAFAFLAHDQGDSGAWPNTFGPCFARYGWT